MGSRRRIRRRVPGSRSATFAGGYDLSFWVADVATAQAAEFWHNAKDDKVFTGINNISWRADRVVFQLEPEEWTRFYSVPVPATDLSGTLAARSAVYGNWRAGESALSGEPAAPTSLTDQVGQIETSSYSPDGKYLYYGTNASDIERRHVWRVPVDGGEPVQLTRGEGIEHDPVVLPSGKRIAVLSAAYNRPQSVGVFAIGPPSAAATVLTDADQNVIFPILTKEFPQDAHVMPQLVMTKAADGLDIHNQLFLPKDLASGRTASGHHFRARRPGPADAPRLSLHGGLPPLLRRQSSGSRARATSSCR